MWFRSVLTANQPYDSVSMDFEAAMIVVSNPTASALLIRVGAPDIPDVSNYDEIVPAGQNASIPCRAREFGVAFNQPQNITAAAATKSGLFLIAHVKFQTIDEPVPAYGSASFLSLSTSDIYPLQAFNAPATVAVFDLGAWGGALVHISPSAATGQGVCQIDVSNDLVTFRPYGTFAFWPNVPSTITVPRVARYMRVVLNSTGIAGEPAIGGYISVRATMAEVQDLTYNPSSQPIVKAFAVAALGTVQYQFVTVGLPSVSIASIITAGTPANAGQEIIIEVAADLVNWRLATFREQNGPPGATMYRAVSNLDLFMRISVLEIANHGPLNGNLYLSIPPAADLGYILNTIQKSLGDNQNPVNVNQDVYHELDTIRQSSAAIQASDASIDTKMTSTNSFLSTIAAPQTRGLSLTQVQAFGAVGGGSWRDTGAILPGPGTWIFHAMLTFIATAAFPVGARNILGLAYGDAANPLVVFLWRAGSLNVPSGTLNASVWADVDLSSVRASGFATVAGQLHLWVYDSIGTGTFDALVLTV